MCVCVCIDVILVQLFYCVCIDVILVQLFYCVCIDVILVQLFYCGYRCDSGSAVLLCV